MANSATGGDLRSPVQSVGPRCGPIGSLPAGRRAFVIGAGIVGTCTALYLRREGFEVTLADRDGPGAGCTAGNAGNLGIASCVPASLPGMLAKVPRLLLDPDEPLSIRWTRLPRLIPWFLRFARAGARDRVEEIADARHSLLRHLFEALDPLLATAGAQDLVRRDGLLHVFENASYLAGARYVIDLRRRRGIRVDELTGDEAREMEPALGPSVVGAVFLPDVAVSVNPGLMTRMLAESFVRAGGRLVRESVRGFEFEDGRARRVATDVGRHDFDVAVIAAGASSRPFASQVGVRVPLEAERGYHIQIPDPGIRLRLPVNSRDRHIAVTPMEEGLRISSIAEFADPDAAPDWRRTKVIQRKARGLFPALRFDGISRWMGARPSLPDSKPVLGAAPRHPNVLCAFGHDHIGLALGAISGKLIAEVAAGRPPSVDLAPFRPDRF